MEDYRIYKQTWQHHAEGDKFWKIIEEMVRPDLGSRTDQKQPNHVDDDNDEQN
jgi:hypothetical protein